MPFAAPFHTAGARPSVCNSTSFAAIFAATVAAIDDGKTPRMSRRRGSKAIITDKLAAMELLSVPVCPPFDYFLVQHAFKFTLCHCAGACVCLQHQCQCVLGAIGCLMAVSLRNLICNVDAGHWKCIWLAAT
eukprot:TsM_000098400 transcript=TsM_000098400 gene=TsM_000098400